MAIDAGVEDAAHIEIDDIAGTRHAAQVCNLENELRTIEPGKIADIIILENNPLLDLKSLLDVRMVIHNGEIIKNDTQ